MKLPPQYILHVGTIKITCLKLVQGLDGIRKVAAFSTRQADGFDRGVVKDLSKASDTLRETVQYVSDRANESIIRARVVVSHPHLKNFIFGSSLYFYGNPHALTIKDVREVIAQTRSVATIPLNEMIIQAVPQEFLVNDLSGISNPIGLEATRLGVTLRLFTMDYTICNNLLRALERADIDATEFIPISLAASRAVLTQEEKEDGVILVDMGGYSTRMDCYKNSILVTSNVIPKGSEWITETLAQKLNLKLEHARRLKEMFVSAQQKPQFSEELIPVTDPDGKENQHITRKRLEEESLAVIRELAMQITFAIRKIGEEFAPITQAVFTGGGAKLDGFLDLAQEMIPYGLRLGIPRNTPGLPSALTDATHADVVGAIGYSSLVVDPNYSPPVSNAFVRVVDSAKHWVGEYF